MMDDFHLYIDGIHGALVRDSDGAGLAELHAADWRSIATAPKDGYTTVLVHCPRLGPVLSGWRGDLGGWVTLWSHELLHDPPTHWMPLPPPPKGHCDVNRRPIA